jgi:hypothetical protein
VQAARQLSDAVVAALDNLKQGDPNGGPLAMIGPMLGPLVDSLKPTSAGSAVTCSLRGEGLNTIANLIVTFRNAQTPPPPPSDGSKPPKPPGQ